MKKMVIAYLLSVLGLLFSHGAISAQNDSIQTIPVPTALRYSIGFDDPPEKILNAFLGVPYRVNGAINNKGQYVSFNQNDHIYQTAGLNCSGFVLEASRFLLQKNMSIEQVKIDRNNDSSMDSPYGVDWDFGWDLILNIAEGTSAQFLLPEGQVTAPSLVTAFSPRGFDLHKPETWQELPTRLKQKHLYLVSFYRDTNKKGYQLQHYHVGLFYVDDVNQIWLYQTTGSAKKVYRRNLSDQYQRAIFLKSFANSGGHRKYIAILEIALPNRT